MNVGKLVRMNRLFSHPSGRLCSVAVDHLMGYSQGIPPGLLHIKQTLAMMFEVVQSGARGATIGRNIWGFEQIAGAVEAFKNVIHDSKTAEEALAAAGLTGADG